MTKGSRGRLRNPARRRRRARSRRSIASKAKARPACHDSCLCKGVEQGWRTVKVTGRQKHVFSQVTSLSKTSKAMQDVQHEYESGLMQWKRISRSALTSSIGCLYRCCRVDGYSVLTVLSSSTCRRADKDSRTRQAARTTPSLLLAIQQIISAIALRTPRQDECVR